MKRVAIIVEKNLSSGAIGNISAILMGQTALVKKEIYSDEQVLDQNQTQHAAIQYSTILLKAGGGQLLNLINQAKEHSELTCVVFTQIGQGLNNKFEEYKKQLSELTTENTSPVGVAISGDEELVKQLTKKFSLLQ